MKNKKQLAAVLLSAILGITANSWFVQADSSVIQDDQQEPDNEAPDSDKVTEGTDTYKGFLLDNVLHSSEVYCHHAETAGIRSMRIGTHHHTSRECIVFEHYLIHR